MATTTMTSKCMLIAFVVLAFIAAPSAAARVQAADQGGFSPLPPVWRPRRPLPCIPGLPRLPWLPPCNASGAPPPPPPPAECHTSLSGLTPCAEFLTNTTGVPEPPAAACCDGLRSLAKDAPVCLCHVVNGDLGKLLPVPVRRLRVAALPRACRVAMPFGTLRQCIRGPVPPMDAPTPS